METEAASPENVVQFNDVPSLTDKIMKDGSQASAEMEQKRKIAFRAFEITCRQLEQDAAKIEQSAIIDDHPMKKRHEMMRTAEALRVATGWITGALLPSNTQHAERNTP